MEVLFLGALVLAAALAACDVGRWAWRWVRRKGWRIPPAQPPQQKVWRDQAFVGMLGAVLMPAVSEGILYWLTHAAPHADGETYAGVVILFGIPLSMGSLWLLGWGTLGLYRFHQCKPDRHNHPKVVASWALAAAWLVLFAIPTARSLILFYALLAHGL